MIAELVRIVVQCDLGPWKDAAQSRLNGGGIMTCVVAAEKVIDIVDFEVHTQISSRAIRFNGLRGLEAAASPKATSDMPYENVRVLEQANTHKTRQG
jgi:hypothetical protein